MNSPGVPQTIDAAGIAVGYAERGEGFEYKLDSRINHCSGAANSPTIKHRSRRLHRLETMDALNLRFPSTDGVEGDGHESIETRPKAGLVQQMVSFVCDRSVATLKLLAPGYSVSIRYAVSVRAGCAGMAAAPQHVKLDAVAMPMEAVRRIAQPTLVVHGDAGRPCPQQSGRPRWPQYGLDQLIGRPDRLSSGGAAIGPLSRRTILSGRSSPRPCSACNLHHFTSSSGSRPQKAPLVNQGVFS